MIMSNLEAIWAGKTDEELLEAAEELSGCTEDGERVIRLNWRSVAYHHRTLQSGSAFGVADQSLPTIQVTDVLSVANHFRRK